MKTLGTLSAIDFAITTANFEFRPRTKGESVSITGTRELAFDQDAADGSYLVLVRDTGDPAGSDEERVAKTHGIRVKDPAGILVLNAIVELLACPARHPSHQDIDGPDDGVSAFATADNHTNA